MGRVGLGYLDMVPRSRNSYCTVQCQLQFWQQSFNAKFLARLPPCFANATSMGVRDLQALASAPAASDPAEEKARQDRAKAPPPAAPPQKQQTKGSLGAVY